MSIFAVGVDHVTAPVELRERLAVPRDDLPPVLDLLRQRAGLAECVVVSTCNRVEIYGVHEDPRRGVDAVLPVLGNLRDLSADELRRHCFAARDEGAARRIFRVTASLESMIVGEPQILGQVKDAYRIARDVGTVGAILDRCLTMAFHGAKRVRTETSVARGAASVPSMAVALARSIFGELRGHTAVVMGAGDMAELAGQHLRAEGIASIRVVNRSEGRGRSTAAAVGGTWVPWSELERELVAADVVVASTGATQPVLDRAAMMRVMRARRGRPIFLIDIAVPRDVAADVSSLEGVYLYDVDDLANLLGESMEARRAQAALASRLVDEEIEAFLRWRRARDVGPVLQGLEQEGQGIRARELEWAFARLGELSPDQRGVVEQMAHRIVRKLLNKPLTTVREAAERGREDLADAVREIFALDAAAGVGEAPAAARNPLGGRDDDAT